MIVNPQSELIREPGLLTPKKIPTGPVKVDLSHPLARNCRGFFLGRDAGREYIENLASTNQNLEQRISGSGTGHPLAKGSEYGAVYDSSNDDLGSYVANSYTDPYWLPSNKLTYMCMFKLFSHQTNGGSPMCRANTAEGARTYAAFKLYSAQTTWYYKDGTDTAKFCNTGSGLNLNQWYTATGIIGKTSNFGGGGLFIDAIDSAEVETGSGVSTAVYSGCPFRLGCGSLDDTTRAFDGQIAWAAMWYDRALEPEEVRSMHDNPYQFLVPK